MSNPVVRVAHAVLLTLGLALLMVAGWMILTTDYPPSFDLRCGQNTCSGGTVLVPDAWRWAAGLAVIGFGMILGSISVGLVGGRQRTGV